MLRRVFIAASTVLIALASVYGQNLLLNPESVAFDYQNNRYLVSNVGDGAIVQIDSNGVQSYFAQGLGLCAGNCIVGNTLYVSADSLIGIDLDSGEIVFSLVIPAMNNLDGMAADSSGHLYVVDTYGLIYKIYLSDTTYTYFVPSGLGTLLQDIIYDHAHNRLIAAGWTANAPVQAVNLEDSSVSTLVTTPVGYFDGITMDPFGNVYLASYFGAGGVYRYDSTFTNPPTLISSPHADPAGLDFNRQDNVLAVPNFSGNTVDFIALFVPMLSIEECTIIDDGNTDGRADPGETCDLIITLENSTTGEPATNVSGEISCDDTAVNLIGTTCAFDNVLPGTSVTNASEPFTFSVGPTEPHFADFTLTVTCDEIVVELPFQIELGRPPVLLVDDDVGAAYEQYYLTSFGLLDIFVDVWEELYGAITADELLRYEAVVWATGDDAVSTLTVVEQSAVQGYLDGGGNFLFSSKNAGSDIGGTTFYADYLHAALVADSALGAFMAYGVDGCPFSSSNDSLFLVGASGAGNFQSLDAINPLGEADTAFTYSGGSYTGGIYFEGAYKLAYLAFPLETVHSAGISVSRDALMAAIFDWFDFSVGISTNDTPYQRIEVTLYPCFPNPFNHRTNLVYTLPQAGNVSLVLFDLQGRLMERLVSGWQLPGVHSVSLRGSDLPSGIYFARLTAGQHTQTQKLILLK